MKKTFLALLTAFVLTFTFMMPVVCAEEASGTEETDLADTLMNLLNSLGDKAGEIGENLGNLADELGKKADEAGAGLGNLFQQITGLFTNENGELDLSLIGEKLGGLFDSGSESGDQANDQADSEMDLFFADLEARNKAVEAYIREQFHEILEPGDEQVLICNAATSEFGDVSYVFGSFQVNNYTAEGKDLKLKNSAKKVECLTLMKNEDGMFAVTEVLEAEEGEGYEDAIAAISEKTELAVGDFLGLLDSDSAEEALNLWMFLAEHPEYERIEYQGELKTEEEMEAIRDANF